MRRLVLIIGLAIIFCFWYVGDKFLNKKGRLIKRLSIYLNGKLGVSREGIISIISFMHYSFALVLIIILILKGTLNSHNINVSFYFDVRNLGVVPLSFFSINIISMMIIFISYQFITNKNIYKNLEKVSYIKNYNKYNKIIKVGLLFITSVLEFIVFNILIPYSLFNLNIDFDAIVYLTSIFIYIIYKIITIKNLQALLIMASNLLTINLCCIFFIKNNLNLFPIAMAFFINLYLYSYLQSSFLKRRG